MNSKMGCQKQEGRRNASSSKFVGKIEKAISSQRSVLILLAELIERETSADWKSALHRFSDKPILQHIQLKLNRYC
jgi:hypothetical protein